MSYADRTDVPAERSRSELERILRRAGATGMMYGYDEGRAVCGFLLAERNIRFQIPLPSRADLQHTATGKARTAGAVESAFDQAYRQRWRALLLVIKAKLESVESGIVTLEEEFLAHIVMPDGATAGEHVLPRIAEAYETHSTPELLPPMRKAVEAR